MLKVMYTETGLEIEYLDQSLEELMTCRIMLAMRFGHRLMIEPGRATVMVPLRFEPWIRSLPQDNEAIRVCLCDGETLELSLPGTWMAQDHDTSEGLFIVDLGDRVEQVLLKVWQAARHSLVSPR